MGGATLPLETGLGGLAVKISVVGAPALGALGMRYDIAKGVVDFSFARALSAHDHERFRPSANGSHGQEASVSVLAGTCHRIGDSWRSRHQQRKAVYMAASQDTVSWGTRYVEE